MTCWFQQHDNIVIWGSKFERVAVEQCKTADSFKLFTKDKNIPYIFLSCLFVFARISKPWRHGSLYSTPPPPPSDPHDNDVLVIDMCNNKKYYHNNVCLFDLASPGDRLPGSSALHVTLYHTNLPPPTPAITMSPRPTASSG